MKRDVILERIYPYPIERVWRALTDPQALGDWLMKCPDFVPEVGHKFRFTAKPQPGWRGWVDCEVLAVEPPRRLSYSWDGSAELKPTTVTWTLAPVAGGTRLRLEHTGFEGVRAVLVSFILGAGWKKMLRTRFATALGRVGDGGYVPAGPAAACH